MMKKFLRNKKDGYVIAWNEHAAANTDVYEEVTAEDGKAPHAPEFLGQAAEPEKAPKKAEKTDEK